MHQERGQTTAGLRALFWSLRREFWENRALLIAVPAVGALFLLGFAFYAVHLSSAMREAALLDPMKQRAALAYPYDIAAALLMLTGMVVAIFYCLDALHGERRDHSILFWKSLPVSDLSTVLIKASIPLIIMPLIVFAVTVATQLLMLLLSSAILAASGQSVSALWDVMSFPRMSAMLLYHLVTVHALWQAPFFGWLLLVSAWARRTPFLWAFLPPIAICYLEKIIFNTTHLLALVTDRIGGGMEALVASGTFPMDPMTQLTPMQFLAAPGLWIGLAITAACLAGAVRLRHYRGPI